MASKPRRGAEGETKFDYSKYKSKHYRYPTAHPTAHPKRGICLIVNNDQFNGQGYDIPEAQRSGSRADVTSLRNTFESLDFDVRVKENRSAAVMSSDVEDAANDHATNEQSDCFFCILMTHGTGNGGILGTDGEVALDVLLSMFQAGKCPEGLIGKPKVFIIQACRGDASDCGVHVSLHGRLESDSTAVQSYVMPSDADKVFVYASSTGFAAQRHTSFGTWFIQVLCAVLDEHARDRDLMWMLQRVSYIIAHEFDQASSDTAVKQMPEIVGKLTSEFYFTPENQHQ